MTRQALRAIASAALLGLLSSLAAAQDYAREKRWEAEVRGNLVVGDAVTLKLGSGHAFLALYTPVKDAKTGIVLVHGIGVHPDHGVIGTLRSALADLGYSTLSIQMPVLASDAGAEAYTVAVFEEASARIALAGGWLRARGPADLVLLSHSLGSRMSLAFLEKTRSTPYAAWVCLGIPADFSGAGALPAPVLDVYGEFDLPAVRAAAPRRGRRLESIPGSRQVVIAGADHFFNGRETQLTAAIDAFIKAR